MTVTIHGRKDYSHKIHTKEIVECDYCRVTDGGVITLGVVTVDTSAPGTTHERWDVIRMFGTGSWREIRYTSDSEREIYLM